jgi:predicted nucleotidyltransferase
MDILFKCQFGSHLYGTDTPESDLDFKGIYKADIRDILLNRCEDTIIQDIKVSKTVKNTSEDQDCEFKELRYFLKEASEGQTYALDMLFSPYSIITSSAWAEIQANRLKLISKKCKPILGYIHQQCAKYAVKGSRLDALEEVMKWAKSFDQETKIADIVDSFPERSQVVDSEIIYHTKRLNIIEGKRNGKIFEDKTISVLGASFQYGTRLKYITSVLEKQHTKYGQRAILAQKNEGVDWKAVSHAVRLILQTNELAETGNITFPLIEKDFVMKIKMGLVDWNEVNDWIYTHIDQVFTKIKHSAYLCEEPDYEWIEQFVIRTYLK